jgi:hypothetical protein
MFQADAKPTQRTKLYVIASGRELKGNRKGETKMMNAYKFAAYPSNNAVASGVTILVSAWFLVAAGLIVTDASAYAPRVQVQVSPMSQNEDDNAYPVPTNVAIAPEARLTINVEAHRSATL